MVHIVRTSVTKNACLRQAAVNAISK